jgi:hypothetical protein
MADAGMSGLPLSLALSYGTCAYIALRNLCDHIVCLVEPQPFRAVGLHYQDFHQVGDDEVVAALEAASVGTRPPLAAPLPGAARPPPPAAG